MAQTITKLRKIKKRKRLRMVYCFHIKGARPSNLHEWPSRFTRTSSWKVAIIPSQPMWNSTHLTNIYHQITLQLCGTAFLKQKSGWVASYYRTQRFSINKKNKKDVKHFNLIHIFITYFSDSFEYYPLRSGFFPLRYPKLACDFM